MDFRANFHGIWGPFPWHLGANSGKMWQGMTSGISPFLDSLLLNTAGLIAEIRHLEQILSGKLKIPEDAYNREIEARISGCTRHLSDIQRGLEPTRQQLEGGHFDEPELTGLLALLEQPEALIDSVAKLVNIRVISPIWSALMTDVRHNILKGRPPDWSWDRRTSLSNLPFS